MIELMHDALEACAPPVAGLVTAVGLGLSAGASALGTGMARLTVAAGR